MANYPEGWVGGLMQAQAFLDDHATSVLDQKEKTLKVAAAQEEINATHKMIGFANAEIEKATKANNGVPPTTAQALAFAAQGAALNGRPLEAVDIIDKVTKAEIGIANLREHTLQSKAVAMETMDYELAASNPQDQQQWQDFWGRFRMAHPEMAQDPEVAGQLEQVAKMPFSPELVSQLKGNLNAAKAKAALDLSEARRQKLLADVKKENFAVDVAGPAKIDADKRRYDARGKTGDIKPASKGELEEASSLIRADYNVGNRKDALAVDAATLVDEAKQLSHTSEMTFNQALRAAYTKFKGERTYDKYPKRPPIPGSSAQAPLDLPITRAHMWSDPKLDTSKLIPNRWYRAPDGTLSFWDGEKVVKGKQ